jgi:UDP-N-acetylglucosamine acyltransferase
VIHQQAIVDPEAKIGKNVDIGAFSIIGQDVHIGDGTWIGPHVVISGPTRIGEKNKIYQFSSLGEAPQHQGYKGEETRLEIGDRNIIREYCTINRAIAEGGRVTKVGNDNFLMAYVHIAHDCNVGNNTIFANCASLAGHVEVGDYTIFGGFTLIHQFCRVGPHCMTGIGLITFKDIPPYVLAAGNTAVPHGINVRGLKRRNFKPEAIDALKRAYKTVYKSGLKLSEAIEKLDLNAGEFEETDQFVSFIRSSKRGIIR